jgi:hypothetical protein
MASTALNSSARIDFSSAARAAATCDNGSRAATDTSAGVPSVPDVSDETRVAFMASGWY